ncbi:MAG: methyltransferase domain-containing protein [Oligoflexia bacterium]|nr:methyltransferase domain-containing protein [Oligoflexia bacterium]
MIEEVFNHYYAKSYNLLYKDKDYQQEVDFIHAIYERFSLKHPQQQRPLQLLSLGCGSGNHDLLLSSQYGYSIVGVDRSQAMIEMAKARGGEQPSVEFHCCDIKAMDFKKSFDGVHSLFHVVNYFNTNEDLKKFFQKVADHLSLGGIGIFDTWYGPAVLTERPETRVKKVSDSEWQLWRQATPRLRHQENIVEVHYDLLMKNQKTNELHEIKEMHSMRYLFHPEILEFLAGCGLELIHYGEFLSDKQLTANTWNAYYVCKKV